MGYGVHSAVLRAKKRLRWSRLGELAFMQCFVRKEDGISVEEMFMPDSRRFSFQETL